MNSFNLTDKNTFLAKVLSYFCIFDLLLLPYFQLIIIPYSLPFVICGTFYFNIKIKKDTYFNLFYLILFSVIISLIISFFLPGRSVWVNDNIKRAIQLLSTFFYFFYFYYISKYINLKIGFLLFSFLIWYTVLAILFFIDPLSTIEFINLIYGRLVVDSSIIIQSFRFPYIFNDPNTGIYFFLIPVGYIFYKFNLLKWTIKTFFVFIILVFLSLFNTLTSQSIGGLISISLMIFFTLIPFKNLINNIIKVKTYIITIIIIPIILSLYQYFEYLAKQNIVFAFAFNKIFNSENSDSQQYISEGGGRFEIWTETFSNFFPYPFGRGAVLLIDGQLWGPHSDLFHYLFSYGFIGAISVFLFFFNRLFKYTPFIIPALISFLINSLVGDQKVLALYLCLLGILLGSEKSRVVK